MTKQVHVLLGFIDGYSRLRNVRQRLGHRSDWCSTPVDIGMSLGYAMTRFQ